MNLMEQIEANFDLFSSTEKKIAALILAEPKEFTSYSLSKFSRLVGASQGSIVNFSRKYADGGFPDLKRQIYACVQKSNQEIPTQEEDSDSVKGALRRNMRMHIHGFEVTEKRNQGETLRSVAEMILRARKIEIYGVYRSAAVATDFYYQLLELGIPVSYVCDILTCAISASMLDRECLVIAISSSGKTEPIINAVKNARNNGVAVVGITANADSPLAGLSDLLLLSAADGISALRDSTEIRTSQLLLMDTVCSLLNNQLNETNRSRIQELNNTLKAQNVAN